MKCCGAGDMKCCFDVYSRERNGCLEEYSTDRSGDANCSCFEMNGTNSVN